MRNIHLALVALSLAPLAGCKSEPKTPPPATSSATAEPTSAPSAMPLPEPTATAAAGPSPEEMTKTCKAEFARQLECKDDFLGVLVDARIKLDLPAGIAAKGKTKAGRDKLLAEAKKEIVVDHAPDKADATCKAMAPMMPKEHAGEMMSMSEKCLAEKDCKAYAACEGPMIDMMLPMMPAAPAAASSAKK